MIVKLKAFARFRDVLGTETEIDQDEGATVADLLAKLLSRSPDLRDQVFDPPGEVREDVNVLVNGRHIESLDGVATWLEEGDEVAIFPAVVGG